MKPVLSISMLVSRNGKTLEKSLKSLQPFFDELETELVIVDTGAPQEAIRLVRQYTDQIIPFTWCQDFSAARNAGLSACSGQWFLYLDDDEWFEDVHAIISFLKSGEEKKYHRLCYRQRNYSDLSGLRYDDAAVERMERRTDELHFIHRIHEELTPVYGEIYYADAYVHHYGYVYENEEQKREHNERNLTLLWKECGEDPQDLRMNLHLIQELLIQGMYDQALQQSDGQLQRVLGQADIRKTPFFSWLCEMHSKSLFLLEQYEELFAFAEAMYQLPDAAELGKLAVSYYALLACVNADQGKKNLVYALRVEALQKLKKEMLSRQEIQGLSRYVTGEYREVTLQLLSIFAYQNGQYDVADYALTQLTWQYDPYDLAHICRDIRAVMQQI